jgi:hypothetical protein
MAIQDGNVLLEIITKIEFMIAEKKMKFPHLSEEEIIELLKNKIHNENKL